MKSFLLFFLFFLTNTKAQSFTTINVILKRGSKLFLIYPISEIESNTLTIYNVTKDSTFSIIIKSQVPFDVSNLNKTITPYLLFPNTKYTLIVKKNEDILSFKTLNKQDETAANFFMNSEKKYFKMNLSNDKSVMPIIFNNKIYTKEIDSFLVAILNYRKQEISKLLANKEITLTGYNNLELYAKLDIQKNRLLPVYNNYFEDQDLSGWYKDSIFRAEVYDNPNYLMLSPYRKCLVYSNQLKAKILYKSDSLDSEIKAVKKNHSSEEINNYLYYIIFLKRKNVISLSFKKYIDSLDIYCTNSVYRNNILKNYNFINKQYDTKNEFFNSLNESNDIYSILRQQKKIIVVDFWASWCAPCIEELQKVNNLISQFQDKNITFLFVSLDENINAWEKSNSRFTFMSNSNSFIVKKSFNSNIAQKLQILTLPRHCIFLNNGQLLYDNIFSEDLANVLNKLLLEENSR